MVQTFDFICCFGSKESGVILSLFDYYLIKVTHFYFSKIIPIMLQQRFKSDF